MLYTFAIFQLSIKYESPIINTYISFNDKINRLDRVNDYLSSFKYLKYIYITNLNVAHDLLLWNLPNRATTIIHSIDAFVNGTDKLLTGFTLD